MPKAPPKAKLTTLELGRFIAASVVVLTHLVPDVNRLAAPSASLAFGGFEFPGSFGVQYFFVLSGFVMASTHGRDFGKVSGMLRFWWRRACRIYPMYWAALLIPLHYLYGFVTPATAPNLFLLSPFADNDFIAPAWSLRFEIAFYLMLGLAMLPYVGKPLLALWIGVVFWRWLPENVLALAHIPPPFIVNKLITGRADRLADVLEFYFFAGLAAGWVFSHLRLGRTVSLALLAAGLVGLCALLPHIDFGRAYGAPGVALIGASLFGLLILGLAGLERAGLIGLGRWAAVAGTISYPLYILHAPLELIFDAKMPHGALPTYGLYTLFVAGLLGIYGIATAATYGFDQPVQRGVRWLTRRFMPAR
jgi:peptidoglycan/LPS O-acetylase OafA/YrhL